MTWMTLIAASIYWFLPAYIANITSTLAGVLHLPFSQPLSVELFGRNKSVRGVYAGILAAMIVVYLQKMLQMEGVANAIRLIDYGAAHIWMLGLLMGTGTVLGDVVKSFFKRRLEKREGTPWVPFDQLDFVLGALLFTLPFYPMEWTPIVIVITLSPLLHFAVNVIGYFLGVKNVWW